MHSYHVSPSPLPKIHFWAAILSILAAYVIHLVLEALPWSLWYLEIPSVLGFYILLLKAWDRRLWRVLPTRKFLCIPRLDGVYKGVLKSSYDDFVEEVPITITVNQDGRSMRVRLETATSRSDSSFALLDVCDTGDRILTFLYQNKPVQDAPQTMHIHYGACILEFEGARPEVLSGHYWSGRDRKNHGTIEVVREGTASPAPPDRGA